MKMEKILVKMEKVEKMEKIIAILEKIIDTMPTLPRRGPNSNLLGSSASCQRATGYFGGGLREQARVKA